MPVKVDMKTGRTEPDLPINDFRKIQVNEKDKPVFSIEVFEDVGKGVCMALLDYIGANPVSRLPRSNYKDIDNMRMEL